MHFEPKIEMRSYISAVNNGLAEQKKNFFLMFFFLIAIRSVLRFATGGKGFICPAVPSAQWVSNKKFK